MNGNGVPSTPGPLTGPSAHPQPQLVSPPVMPSAVPNGAAPSSSIQKLAQANEQTWLLIGRVAEQMGNLEHALSAYENALRHNPMSLSGLTQVAGIARIKENYPKAVDYFQRVIAMQQDNGEVWSALGHCYLMQDDLQKAYAAYQQALYLLPNPKEDPKLWYGIGILYDRYGSLDHAEEAFASVLKMDKDFDKANEILFRLGIIYKQQSKYAESLDCFDRILRNPPNPLAHADIWFQIGHVFEQQRDHVHARDAYERVVRDSPGHAKVLQQLGWLYHQDGSSFQNQEVAIQYLTKSLEADPTDAQSWYLLGRAYMAGQKYNKAYEAYQQAVYRDGRNPTFWCSIGVLYFQINQYRDALDAYSRAIRINPYISEVWFDLGSLYESCNNQISDAIDAYARAAELDPSNTAITQRLVLLKQAQATGSALPAAPGPQDVHPTAYANPMMPPPGLSGPPMLLQPGANSRPTPIFRTDSRGPPDLALPMPPQPVGNGRSSPGPYRGGPPPPVVLDDRHIPSRTPLAPMDVDRPPMHPRESTGPYPPRENGRGPAGQSLLLHHPVPQQQPLPDALRGPSGHALEPPQGHYRMSPSASPPPHAMRPQSSIANGRPPYDGRPPIGPGQPAASRRSPPPPHPYARDHSMSEREPGWDRRIPLEQLEWEREQRRGRPGSEYLAHQQAMYSRGHSPPRAPSPRGQPRSPPMSPAAPYQRQYWDARHVVPAGPAVVGPGPSPSMAHRDEPVRRYDPLLDAREGPPRNYERGREPEREMVDPREMRPESRFASPESIRTIRGMPPSGPAGYGRASESPRMPLQSMPGMSEPKDRRRRNTKDKDSESSNGSVTAAGDAPKKERKRRAPTKRVKEEPSRQETPGYGGDYNRQMKGSPHPSSTGSGSAGRSVQPSPTGSAPPPPSRVVDEDYDEGVAEALMGLSQSSNAPYRGPADPRSFGPPSGPGTRPPPIHSPTMLHHDRRQSMSSRASPPSSGTKRALSPGPDDRDTDLKRTRVGSISSSGNGNGNRRVSPHSGSGGRPSPIPFRQQPTSHSPEARQPEPRSFPPSPAPALPTMLPPHPRPIGMSLPPMNPGHASPGSSGPLSGPMEEERMHHARSASPARQKREIVLHQAGGTPPGASTAKGTPSPSSSNGRSGPLSS
ncbi:hypothetical protein FOMPIDRAFT_79914 [Fomitopsis schrenkii]|uniref:Cytochrome c-type biogenesis protein H TPR domain-containing protein n=1 Tax=Fomitopsis schrenkii TaxID=2126942 RepID=S8F8U0_FOMSC|nr:hypothetical protein FOMPIDRAFT_79914 [Fomitopsis schrenkii]